MSEETKVDVDYMIAQLGLTVDSVYVPMEKGDKPRLKWVVTLNRLGKKILSCTYTAGVDYAPSWPAQAAYDECRTGLYAVVLLVPKPISPDIVDVVASLCLDASAIDYASFEDWANNCGYDFHVMEDPEEKQFLLVDYKQCLEYALKLKAAIGDEDFQALRDACSNL